MEGSLCLLQVPAPPTRLTFPLLPPLTDNHAHHLALLWSCLNPPSHLPGGRSLLPLFQNRSPRSLHHPSSVSPSPKGCKLLRSGGGAPPPLHAGDASRQINSPPFSNTCKHVPNPSVLTSLILVPLAQQSGLTESSPLFHSLAFFFFFNVLTGFWWWLI